MMLAALIRSPVARAGVFALLVFFGLSYWSNRVATRATEAAEAICRADTADALNTERERQGAANRESLAAAAERAILAEREAIALREKADALIKDLSGANGSCRFDDSTLQRLRGIR